MAGREFKTPEVLAREEHETLLRQPNPRYPTGERNQLLLHVMLDTGLKLSGAINLRQRDLDLLTGRLYVKQGKGPRIACFGWAMRLEEWITVTAPLPVLHSSLSLS